MESVIKLVDEHPEFAEIYHEIALFREDPKEVVRMFSEALAFLDKNTERYMVDYYAEKAEAETLRADQAESERKAETLRADQAEERADKAEKDRFDDRRKFAIKMLKDGQSVKKVAEYLSISEAEVIKIKEEIMFD